MGQCSTQTKLVPRGRDARNFVVARALGTPWTTEAASNRPRYCDGHHRCGEVRQIVLPVALGNVVEAAAAAVAAAAESEKAPRAPRIRWGIRLCIYLDPRLGVAGTRRPESSTKAAVAGCNPLADRSRLRATQPRVDGRSGTFGRRPVQTPCRPLGLRVSCERCGSWPSS